MPQSKTTPPGRIYLTMVCAEILKLYGKAPKGGWRGLQSYVSAAKIPAVKLRGQWSVARSDLEMIARLTRVLPPLPAVAPVTKAPTPPA